MNLLEYLRLHNISIDDVFERKKLKKGNILPFNNRAENGYNIKTNLVDKISISNPKFWPKKGFFESKNN
tara:strand:- start:38 stop:244 length:207 start_codon:yes stop_codon:yes gene_type:complete